MCDWSTLQTAVITGLSSPRSVCRPPSAALVIRRVPSTPRPSTNTGGGSLSTFPVLLSTCVLYPIVDSSGVFSGPRTPRVTFPCNFAMFPLVPPELGSVGFKPTSPQGPKDGLWITCCSPRAARGCAPDTVCATMAAVCKSTRRLRSADQLDKFGHFYTYFLTPCKRYTYFHTGATRLMEGHTVCLWPNCRLC